MAFVRWEDTYSVDIAMIDDQHKRLFELLEQFHEAIRHKQTKLAISDILKGMTNYTVYHFSSEETLMTRHNYPAYLQHKNAHSMFIDKVSNFRERFESGQLLIPLEIANFLKDWLSNHILFTDKHLGHFISQQNPTQ